MQSVNFEFLRDQWSDLATLGGFAEQYISTDPRSCLATCRTLTEEVTRLVCREHDIDCDGMTFFDALQSIEAERIMPPFILNALHTVRQAGNKATHSAHSSNHARDALNLVRSTFFVSRWWYCFANDINEDTVPNFTEHIPSRDVNNQENARFLEEIRSKNQSLENINKKLIDKNAQLHQATKAKDTEIQNITEEFQKKILQLQDELAKQMKGKNAIIHGQKADVLITKGADIEASIQELAVQQQNKDGKDWTPQDVAHYEQERENLIRREKDLLQELEQLKAVISQDTESADTSPEISPALVNANTLFGIKKKIELSLDISEENMDDDQLDLIEKTLDKSMLVSGCAGSGKSVIAFKKAQQIYEKGGDVILIVYTKSLNKYISHGLHSGAGNMRFYYHWQWKNLGMPKADYIIVDEIQDFSRQEIGEFVAATRKNYFFFGDTAQSIYNFLHKGTLTIDEISALTGIDPLYLYNNYRLPRAVAQITQTYVSIDGNAYSEKMYKSKVKSMPYILKLPDIQTQCATIMRIYQKVPSDSVGILVPNNELVLALMDELSANNFVCEFKYARNQNDSTSRDTLNFASKHPKLMTYHSAKGLQFETVILPMYSGAQTDTARKALYVAMTRTYRHLYILYATDTLAEPLNIVPAHLYLTDI